MLNKPLSKTLNHAQGAEDARRALALQPSEPRSHSRTQAQPALAEHSSLHKSLSQFSSRAGHLSLPPVGVELPWAASPHKRKGSVERSIARAIVSSYFCCCFSSFCLTVGLCSRPARHIALQLLARLLRLCHNPAIAGHPGQNRIYYALRREYYWPHLASDVAATVRGCRTLAMNWVKLGKHLNRLRLFPAMRPLESLAIDILGPLPKTKTGKRF